MPCGRTVRHATHARARARRIHSRVRRNHTRASPPNPRVPQILSFSSEPSTQIDLTGDDGRGAAEDDDGEGEAAKAAGGLMGMLNRSRRAHETPAVATAAAAALSQAEKKGALQKRVKAVKKEIEALQARLEAERGKYASSVSSEMIAVQSDLKVRHTFALSEGEACYRLNIEISKPLEFVLLQSDVPMEVLDTVRAEAGETVEQAKVDDDSSAIVSRTKVGHSNLLLATYRVTDNATRLTIRLRTIEGRYGNLNAYIVPKGKPKTAQAATYQIRPLSLHRRLPALPESAAARPMSELRLTGTFSLAELHSWVCLALPEVPERVTADEMVFNFTSTFLGTLLLCSYRKGDATFRSDNLTTLTTLKEVVGREATQRKVQVKTSYDVNNDSITYMLKLIDPLLAYQNALSHRVRGTRAADRPLRAIALHLLRRIRATRACARTRAELASGCARRARPARAGETDRDAARG